MSINLLRYFHCHVNLSDHSRNTVLCECCVNGLISSHNTRHKNSFEGCRLRTLGCLAQRVTKWLHFIHYSNELATLLSTTLMYIKLTLNGCSLHILQFESLCLHGYLWCLSHIRRLCNLFCMPGTKLTFSLLALPLCTVYQIATVKFFIQHFLI